MRQVTFSPTSAYADIHWIVKRTAIVVQIPKMSAQELRVRPVTAPS
ncbi:MAG: hypothetical protein H0V09_02645 [Gemmatimonadetes bacterium]|nr:hypothetical protein [Gemmatimonadota bacterium]